MDRRWISLLLSGAVIVAITLLCGCNTVEGVGRDVQAVGEGTADLARDANPDK